ncbi:MAG: FAD-dependent oxidoreductase [Alphaproteobacteria bacterium]|jgi:D-amino-acid dehydrogenase|nr:FAD-dependent oxidoreductase [Rhodospirillaceae bacterium]MDG2481532.1 FAD-dependent oxidoreductase [Alphaproteobacteria bacterium]MBT6204521.1 FAD-dependent oxidoreductase [Rhodospirillaceae bacterium]MBT6512790.1 FAD-dependent oxidoreductase [Rhodospirillaceae bacterium]MBT7614486.1 FAD-dependent oxidoreductase [Rhodospirillaceae bacterium]
MADRHHVTVIGAGIVGVCAGLSLLRDGHDVTIIDRDGPGENCSFGNAGIICDTTSALPMPSPGVIREIPKMLFDRRSPITIRWSYLPSVMPWLIAFLKSSNAQTRLSNARAFYELLDGTTRAFEGLTRGTPNENLIKKRGMLGIYETDSGYEGGAQERSMLADLGAESIELGSEELRQMEPALSPSVKHASFLPGCHSTINPYKLTRGLADQFVAEGGTIDLVEVTGIHHGSGRVTELETTGGERKVDRLVVAAGAWSHRVAAMLGLKVLLDTERGYHTVFHGVDTGLTRPLIHNEAHFGLGQMDEGVRFAGTVELAGVDAAPDYRRADVIYECGRHILRDFDPSGATEVTQWMGRRPTLPDYLPALGSAPGFSNLWFDFGHQHLGLSLAARSGAIIADLVAGRDPGLDLHAFRPDRF